MKNITISHAANSARNAALDPLQTNRILGDILMSKTFSKTISFPNIPQAKNKTYQTFTSDMSSIFITAPSGSHLFYVQPHYFFYKSPFSLNLPPTTFNTAPSKTTHAAAIFPYKDVMQVRTFPSQGIVNITSPI